jgi:protein-tyrosine phosphatase
MRYAIATALSLLIAPHAAHAAPDRPIGAERIDAQHVVLDWQGWATGRPVTISVADRPEAIFRRSIVRKERDAHATITLTKATRPYFWLRPRGGKGRWVAERVLPLQGSHNFRDLGGYETRDGRTVRWGVLYRSAKMSGLTAGDYSYLGSLGIRSVCDLRTNSERAGNANAWVREARIGYWTRDYEISGGNVGALFSNPSQLTHARMMQMMTDFYRSFPQEQAPAYREMFRQLVAGQLPLAFNCTAGKDRTGLAAALVPEPVNDIETPGVMRLASNWAV